MDSTQLNERSPRFRDIVHFSHATPLATFAHNSVEQLGSFYGRTFEQLPIQDKPETLQVSFKHEPSNWKALAIIIQALFIVITLLAIATKWLLRRHYILEIKPNDTNATDASLPGDRRSTNSDQGTPLNQSIHAGPLHEVIANVASFQGIELPSPMSTPQSLHTHSERSLHPSLLDDFQARLLRDHYFDGGFFNGPRHRATPSSACRIVDEEGKELPLFKPSSSKLNPAALEAMLAALEEEEFQEQLLQSQRNPNITITEIDE